MHDRDCAPETSSVRADVAPPVLSVVVAFKRSERCVLHCLQSIFDMDYPVEKLEVIVVDDWRDDCLAELIRKQFPVARLLRNLSPVGCDGAKQAGVNAAIGDIIAFTDADCTVSPLWGRAIAGNLTNEADAVTGPVRHPRTFLRELIAVSDFGDFQGVSHGWVGAFPGCNFAVRGRELRRMPYNRSGDIRGGSDRLLSWHLHANGRRIRYDPAVVVHHAPAVDTASLVERRLMYGRAALAMRRLDPTLPGSVITRLGPLAPPAYVCYKVVRDTHRLLGMARRQDVCPWHVPLLLPALIFFRLVDALGVLSAGRVPKP